MLEGQTVIYTAHTIQDAHLLKSLLAEERIEAVVLSDPTQLNLAPDAADWNTAAGVAVSASDATRAKQLAARFHAKAATTADEPPTVLDEWPRCPECDARRSTRCSVCHTVGTDFPQADMGFIWIPGPEEASEAASCGCGSGCSHGESTTGIDTTGIDTPDGEEPRERSPLLLVCPTCDEPFQPEYPRLCQSCGHEFDDGFDLELPTEPEEEQVGFRVIAVVAGMVLLAAALTVYFMSVLSGSSN